MSKKKAKISKKLSKRNKPEQKRRETTRTRDAQIIAEHVSGKRVGQIAKERGLSRTTVSKALNSDTAKEIMDTTRAKLMERVDKCMEVIDECLDARGEGLGHAKDVALRILKSLGALPDKIDMNHQFPTPLIIRRRKGGEIILGTEADIEE